MKIFLKILAAIAFALGFIYILVGSYAFGVFWLFMAVEFRIEYIILLIDKDET